MCAFDFDVPIDTLVTGGTFSRNPSVYQISTDTAVWAIAWAHGCLTFEQTGWTPQAASPSGTKWSGVERGVSPRHLMVTPLIGVPSGRLLTCSWI